jgi:hypothetical protein
MTDTFRAVCAELIEAIDSETADWEDMEELKDRARALLAQPVAEGLTDEALLEAFDGEFAEFFDSSDGFGTTAISRSEWTKVARAVLARWGHPTPVPVAVSERLPGVKDCDEQGRCWWLTLAVTEGGRGGYSTFWELTTFRAAVRSGSHWLPFNALPLPQGNDI